MNIMSEFMGLIYGQYDAKAHGFLPGGFSLHNCMLPHGPDTDAFARASTVKLQPHKLEGTMAFMLETRHPQHVTAYAFALAELQSDYVECWSGIKKNFNPMRPNWEPGSN
jgi:homogentisate 1,2-dioxygenase